MLKGKDMDTNNLIDEASELSNKHLNASYEYYNLQKKYGKVKAELNIIYASKSQEINEIKKNAGYDTGMLIMIGKYPLYQNPYKEMINLEQQCKGLDKVIEAIKSRIMYIQSIMKYQLEGERYGN